MQTKMIWPAIVSAGVVLAASHASAASYLYTYTGNDLTGVTSACCGTPDTPFTTSDFISFQFRSTGQLGPNEDDAGFAAPISSWKLSVGPLHYSSADGSVLYSINFSTNALSQITEYQFTTQTDVVAPNLVPAVYPPTPYEEEVFSFDFPELKLGPEDGIYIPSIAQDSTYAYNQGSPGTWTVSAAVPEPASWTMLLLGVAGAGGMLRLGRKRRIPA